MPADVSIIITAYNVEAYIERAIRSVLDQEGVTVEVVVVNDASTDTTAAVISSIGDARVKHIDLAAKGGMSITRNAGIDAATASWIAILDGNDAFLPGRLMRCLTRAKAVKADIVIDNLIVRCEADGAEYPMFPPNWFSRLGMIDLAGFIANNCSFLGGRALGCVKPVFATEFLRRHNLRYDPEIRIVEDYFMLTEALAQGARCAAEPSAGYSYTVRMGSVSHHLNPADLLHFAESDKKFLARHTLGPAAARAQKRRDRSLKEAYAFTQLVDAIKRRDVSGAVRIVTKRPTAVLYLWRPVIAGAVRLFK